MNLAGRIMRAVLIAMMLGSLLTACGTTAINSDSTASEGSTKLNKGESAPAFLLNDLQGQSYELASYSGRKVYVKYWASWCSICLAGLEELNTLAGEAQDFEVITIVAPNYKAEKSAIDFTAWFTKQPYPNITVLLDEDGKWAKKFGVIGYPSSYYIGSDGILVKGSPGHASNDQITETFKEIM